MFLPAFTDAIWRACRIILDVRMHRGELTPDEATDFLVEHTAFERANARAEVRRYTYSPGYQLSYLLGKILNALLVDHTEYDIEQLRRTNALMQAGESLYGPDFSQKLGNVVGNLRGASYRVVKPLVIKPSQNIGVVAAKYARLGSAAARAGGIVGRIIRRIGEDESLVESDLLSYLLFDGDYARELIELGMHDADAARSQLIDFFTGG